MQKITFDMIEKVTDNIDKGLVPEPLVEPTEEDLYELAKDKEHFFKYLPYLIAVSTTFSDSDIVITVNNIIDEYVED